MKKLLQLLCIATLFVFVACSPEQKENEVWVKIDEDLIDYNYHAFRSRYKKKGEWYVIKLTEEDVSGKALCA